MQEARARDERYPPKSRGTGNNWKELKLRKSEGKHVSGDLSQRLGDRWCWKFIQRFSDFPYVSDRSPNPRAWFQPGQNLSMFWFWWSKESSFHLFCLRFHHSALGKDLCGPQARNPNFQRPLIQMLQTSHNWSCFTLGLTVLVSSLLRCCTFLIFFSSKYFRTRSVWETTVAGEKVREKSVFSGKQPDFSIWYLVCWTWRKHWGIW